MWTDSTDHQLSDPCPVTGSGNVITEVKDTRRMASCIEHSGIATLTSCRTGHMTVTLNRWPYDGNVPVVCTWSITCQDGHAPFGFGFFNNALLHYLEKLRPGCVVWPLIFLVSDH